MFNSEGVSLADLGNREEITKMESFWRKMGIPVTKFVMSSHMNLSWFGKMGGKEVVCQVGPGLSEELFNSNLDLTVTKYFSSSKYTEAKIICDIAESSGIPCPQIFTSGVINGRSWAVVEKVEGVGLDILWASMSELEQKSALETLGGYLARLHSLKGFDIKVDPHEWYQQKLDGILGNLLAAEVYTKEESEYIKNILDKNLDVSTPPLLTITHNDILQKNILLDPDTLRIRSIIDWETSGVGDPRSDLILGAWWMSGEYGGNEELYEAMVVGYNQKLTDEKLKLSLEKAKKLNPHVDVMWYLNILWVRKVMGDDSQTERRKGAVEKILKELE